MPVPFFIPGMCLGACPCLHDPAAVQASKPQRAWLRVRVQPGRRRHRSSSEAASLRGRGRAGTCGGTGAVLGPVGAPKK
eukprot:365688-Chlamydomonas_euryale.AAC.1